GYAWVIVHLRWLVVLAWAAAAIAAQLYLPGISSGSSSSPQGLVPKHAQALAVQARSDRLFGIPLLSDTAVVQRDPHGLSVSAQARVVQRALALDRHADPAL